MYPGSKLNHFQALSANSGIPCHKMLFFDDESRNKEVSRLGVHFTLVNTKTGITPLQFENALQTYAKNSNSIFHD
jgi:magnesium-dependent phosphatase 1